VGRSGTGSTVRKLLLEEEEDFGIKEDLSEDMMRYICGKVANWILLFNLVNERIQNKIGYYSLVDP
jgi:hypothetical protein